MKIQMTDMHIFFCLQHHNCAQNVSYGVQEKDQAIQKRAYKLLAYILEHRSDASINQFQEILDSLLLGVASSMSAAKRYRLKCLKVNADSTLHG